MSKRGKGREFWDGNQWLTLSWDDDDTLAWYEGADPTFTVSGDLANLAWDVEGVALGLLRLYRRAFARGESCGRGQLQYELRRLIGAVTAES